MPDSHRDNPQGVMKLTSRSATFPFCSRDEFSRAKYSGLHGVSLAEAVRRGIACLKAAEGHTAYRKLVRNTGGIWKRGDALRYQEDIRSEWEKPSC